MKDLLPSGRIVVAAVLLASAAVAGAQSLGAATGEAWIGRPLAVTVATRLASADSRDDCVHADVFYGQQRLSPAQVRTSLVGPESQRRVRIEADAPVNEPMVTVSVRAGCANSVTRSYTLLPEMPSEALLAAWARPASAPPTAVAGAPARLPAAGATLPALRPTRALAREPAPRAAPARALPAAALATTPRLRVEPLQPDARALLRTSAFLADTGDVARRATAALLWQALNADPRELMRSSANLQQLEQELAQLRQAAGQTRSEMTLLRRRLDEAQPWYFSQRTAQWLAVLVLLAAAATVFVAWRTRREARAQVPLHPVGLAHPSHSAWHEAALEPAEAEEVLSPQPPVQRRAEPAAVAPPTPLRSEPRAPAIARAAPVPAPQPAPPQPRRATSGLLRVETLAATFEEVDFLSSLGLAQDAMDVLKTYVEDSASPSPLAYHELMRLCGAEDAAAVEAVRRRYAQVFGVEAPRLEQVAAPAGLEANRALADRISRAWGSGDALEVIERCLFDVPAPGAALSVQAGRDLICLYDVAMALATDSDAGRAAGAHPLAPWAEVGDVDAAHAVARAVADDVGGHRFALDVDLTAAPAELPDRPPELDRDELMARLLAEKEAARQAAARRAAEEEDAFSAAVASERLPLARF